MIKVTILQYLTEWWISINIVCAQIQMLVFSQ